MINEYLIQFFINLVASIIGVSIALWFNRQDKKETIDELKSEIKRLKESLKRYIKKYGDKNGNA